MTITHQGAAAHLVEEEAEEEGEGASIPLVDWSSERKRKKEEMLQETPDELALRES